MDSLVTPPPRRRLLVAALLIAVAVVAAAAAVGRRRLPVPAPVAEESVAASVSPYLNTRPGVKYVGDAACASCHPDVSETYRRHPMNRTLTPADAPAPDEHLDAAAHNPFDKAGVHFLVEQRDGRVFHREQCRDADGRVVAEHRDEVRFAVGSGGRGRSYVTEREGGYLFVSPISWFAQDRVWDVTPGMRPTALEGRPVEARCLFCHSDPLEAVPDTLNRYRLTASAGHGVGCERCHGPGELHAAERERGADPGPTDFTIVNPVRLEPELREEVCQQCHLTGKYRVLHHGREPFDFRPGLRLRQYWNVFVKPPRLAGTRREASRVEQMVASRCFQASRGKMGCISCHDPHAVPAPERRVVFYRDRCLKCHEQAGCSVPETVRRETAPDDSCVRCHMPRLREEHMAHTTDTDHRILRRPEPPAPTPVRALASGESPLIAFHQDLHAAGDLDTARDLGIALVELAQDYPPLRSGTLPLADSLLREVLDRRPEDPAAWEARARGLRLQGRERDALVDLDAALAQAPRHETALAAAAEAAAALGERARAIAYGRRAVAVNPWPASYHRQLARLLAESADWSAARAEARAALRGNPADVEARTVLVLCLLQAGDRAGARAEFDVVAALKPANLEELRRWFEERAR